MKAAGTKKQEKAEKSAKKAAKEGLGSAKQQHLPARNRRKQRRELARKIQTQGAAGTGQRTGASIWLCDGRVKGNGEMAEAVRDTDGGHAVHGSVLAAGVRRVGGRGPGSLSGKRARDQESAGEEDGCAGESMADATAHLRAAAKFVPASPGNPRAAELLAAAK